MSEANIEAVSRQYELVERTGELLAEIYDPDAEWMAAREDPDAETHRGTDAIQAYFTKWVGAFEDVKLEPEELVPADDKVFAWIRFAGRGAASGVPVELKQAQVWSFSGGKVVRVEEYFDRDEGFAAAGLAK
jgi:ketosteroid isomerase-like protein